MKERDIVKLIEKYLYVVKTCLNYVENNIDNFKYNPYLCIELFDKTLGLKLKRITTCPEYDIETLEFTLKILEDLYQNIIVLIR